MAKQSFHLDQDSGNDITSLECSTVPPGSKPVPQTSLQESPVEPHSDESLDINLLTSVLLKETKTLCQFIDIPTLLPVLQSRQLVTGEEFLCLLNRWEQGSHKSTVGILLEILPRKHPNWALLLFESFREEEEHKGHVYLVDLLEESVQQKHKVYIGRN